MISTRTLTDQTASGDPYFSNVSLLLHMDGTNGSTTFTDSSSNNLTVTPSGNAQISTAQSKFGGASGLFDGTGDYLTISASSLFNFGTGALTIEMFFRIATGASASPFGKVLMSNENNSWGAGAFTLYALASTSTFRPSLYVNDFSASTPLLQPSTGDYRDDAWHYLAITRQASGGSCKMYIDGTEVATGTHTGQFGSSSRNLVIANNLVSQREILGNLDEARITKGTARTITSTPTGPFPNS
jgi:hypothetical protein